MTDEIAKKFLDKTLWARYIRLITNGFVSHNPLIKWCQAACCSNAVQVELAAENQPAVQCRCGFRFCFSCNEESHDLIPCKLLKDFEAVKAVQMGDADWLVHNTKPCPNCHAVSIR